MSIQKARKIIGLPYSELSKKTGIDKAQWSRWFNGKQSPTLEALEEIAEQEGVSASNLIKAFLERKERVMKSPAPEPEQPG